MNKQQKNWRKNKQARKRARQQVKQRLLWGGAVLAAVALIGFLIWQAVRPTPGESVPLMTATHVETGTDPGEYNSNPPTSGPHYPNEFEAGFYDESAPQVQVPYPAGYLVHNLEHGYVIFWYNCAALQEGSCEDLKAQIQETMGAANRPKLIAFPWPSLDAPVALTSWSKLLKMPVFDRGQALAFVRGNYNRAPEPNAP